MRLSKLDYVYKTKFPNNYCGFVTLADLFLVNLHQIAPLKE